jgi:hypothetical protein
LSLNALKPVHSPSRLGIKDTQFEHAGGGTFHILSLKKARRPARALGAESAQHDRRASRAASIGAMRIRAARDYRIKEIASGTAAT